MTGVYSFNPVIQEAVQTGLLDLEFKKALDTMPAFSAFTYPERLKARLGETKRFTRNSRLPVSVTPVDPANDDSNINNGLTAAKAGIEQFEISLLEWGGLDYVNLFQDEAMISSDLLRSLGNLGEQARITKERLVRKAYLDTYYGGNTIVISGGTTNTTHVHVDDIRGFQHLLDANGKLQDVSGTYTITAYEKNPSTGAVIQTLTITGAVADGSNVSGVGGSGTIGESDASMGGISGTLTFSTASQPTAGNVIVAEYAPAIRRAGGRLHYSLLGAGDLATIPLIDSCVTYLRNQGMRGYSGGKMYAICGPSTTEQLRKDPQFLLAYQGRYEAPEIRGGTITEYAGVRYVETTEVPMTTISATGKEVGRVLIVGDPEACMEANWDGFDDFLAGKSGSALHYVQKMQSNLALITRDPIDVQGKNQPLSWIMATGFCCGSDLKATKQIIPTASKSMFKKAIWAEHIIA